MTRSIITPDSVELMVSTEAHRLSSLTSAAVSTEAIASNSGVGIGVVGGGLISVPIPGVYTIHSLKNVMQLVSSL